MVLALRLVGVTVGRMVLALEVRHGVGRRMRRNFRHDGSVVLSSGRESRDINFARGGLDAPRCCSRDDLEEQVGWRSRSLERVSLEDLLT